MHWSRREYEGRFATRAVARPQRHAREDEERDSRVRVWVSQSLSELRGDSKPVAATATTLVRLTAPETCVFFVVPRYCALPRQILARVDKICETMKYLPQSSVRKLKTRSEQIEFSLRVRACVELCVVRSRSVRVRLAVWE